MATYAELANIASEPGYSAFKDKVTVAIAIKAVAIVDSVSPNPNALKWARSTLASRVEPTEQLLWYAIASNASASTDAIINAPDTAIQAAIDAAVDAFYS